MTQKFVIDLKVSPACPPFNGGDSRPYGVSATIAPPGANLGLPHEFPPMEWGSRYDPAKPAGIRVFSDYNTPNDASRLYSPYDELERDSAIS
jgi:hypothetical protein